MSLQTPTYYIDFEIWYRTELALNIQPAPSLHWQGSNLQQKYLGYFKAEPYLQSCHSLILFLSFQHKANN